MPYPRRFGVDPPPLPLPLINVILGGVCCKLIAKTGPHHTLLHECFKQQASENFRNKKLMSSNTQRQVYYSPKNQANTSQQDDSEVLLATALVKVTAEDGKQHIMRALIDQGSQISIITERAAQQLGLKRQQSKGIVLGVGGQENNCRGKLKINCQSIYNNFTFNVDTFIMTNLIKNLPNRSFEKPGWSKCIAHLNLADPEFNKSRAVDILFGADIYSYIMLDGIIRGREISQPLAQQTQLGWLLCGGSINTFHCNVILNHIQEIQDFWKIEDIQEQNDMSAKDKQCLDYYLATTKRLKNGRYEVSIPMEDQALQKLGSSEKLALAQFMNLENKLNKQHELSEQYKQFMSEYIQLGHMKIAALNSSVQCFLPHHGVQRAASSTTKLRVVFNGSAKTTTGYSLNDLMHKGPNMQKDLQSIIINWRLYRYAYTSDIEKMYRQILVKEEDQKLQQIWWRSSPDQPIKAYQLTTITYGTKAAPFLAIMTLNQLAQDEQNNFPKAAKSIKEEFYMDDYISGAHTISEGQQKIAEVNHVLSGAGFLLRKWIANDKSLIENIISEERDEQSTFMFKTENTPKTLGLRWDPISDVFVFDYDSVINEYSAKLTKRKLLSEMSKLFDPLGWLTPLTTKIKILFQKVWLQADLEWRDPVSQDIKSEWIKIKKELNTLKCIKIPRWYKCDENSTIELHGFCDASIKAYACVVYARVVKNSSISTIIIAAKSRLVPNKKEVSLPRLELCAMELLTKLMNKIKNSISSTKVEIYGWSDSMVALGWINGNPDRWKPFVANRVKKIHETMQPQSWRYIKTKENPADAASRGQTALQLKENLLWWRGPGWLLSSDFKNKQQHTNYTTNLEIRKQVNIIQKAYTSSIIDHLLYKYSSLLKIVRVLAWILRAITPSLKQRPTYLTLQDVRKAKTAIIKYVQSTEFSADLEQLKKDNKLRSNSALLSLNPFLDENGILRVGGRLKNSNISEDMKHPIIIPYSGRLTELLINEAHELSFHGGAKITISILRQKYWIIKGYRATKKQLRTCITCKKREPTKLHQLMGDMPSYRVNPAPPFYHTGVDFTGFVNVKINKGRGVKTTKGYIALFICMVTKAVHIEIVSDLSSTTFIAALRRMAARRGTPKHIYSDNGTNFVGANKIIQQEYNELISNFSDSFYKEITEMEIERHWNCPSWPSAGGIWERSIRSLKQHIKRVVGEQALTFEEYSTILAQIEGCLNSRPLCSITEDVEDLDFLTPSHFLNQRAENTLIETAHDARTRWYLVDKTFNDIWKRWKNEYLSQLTVRSKWLEPQRNLKIGDLVTIHDDIMPAGKWPVGRVVETHPGSDGLQLENKLYLKPDILETKLNPIHNLINSALPITNYSDNEEINTSLKSLGEKIKIMKNAVDETDTLGISQHDLHQYAVSYGTLALTILASILFFVWWRRSRATPQQSVPGAQQQSVPAAQQTIQSRTIPQECVDSSVCVHQKSVTSVRASPLPERGECISEVASCEQNRLRRWASARFKRSDRSTSPIANKRSAIISDSVVEI
ncbi:uncharacterized protein LOC123703948 [Colias croceus]|uniref:uncharacterized protein LOC123703948 n=1 Tax=Colias crocea TaxID=72248 RepID=UPI001E27BB58|nr:uncharacterized protein LOC123703948 [Colias croceus]